MGLKVLHPHLDDLEMDTQGNQGTDQFWPGKDPRQAPCSSTPYLSPFFHFAAQNCSWSELWGAGGGTAGAAENSWLAFLILCSKRECLCSEKEHVQM